jgi:hypothetical protein
VKERDSVTDDVSGDDRERRSDLDSSINGPPWGRS